MLQLIASRAQKDGRRLEKRRTARSGFWRNVTWLMVYQCLSVYRPWFIFIFRMEKYWRNQNEIPTSHSFASFTQQNFDILVSQMFRHSHTDWCVGVFTWCFPRHWYTDFQAPRSSGQGFGWRDKNKQIARCFLRSGTPQGTWIRLFVASECIWWVLRNPNSRKKSHLPNGFKSVLPVCVYWVHWDMFNPLHVCQFLQGWPVGIISKSMPFACRFRVAVVNLMPPMVWWSQMVPSVKQKTETLRWTLSPGDSRNKVLGPVHPATFWKRKCLTAAVSTIDWDQSSTKDPNSQVLTLNGVSNLYSESSAGQFEATTRVGWLVGSIPTGDYLGSISHEIGRERNFHGFSMRLSLPDSCSPIVSCSVCLILCQKPTVQCASIKRRRNHYIPNHTNHVFFRCVFFQVWNVEVKLTSSQARSSCRDAGGVYHVARCTCQKGCRFVIWK